MPNFRRANTPGGTYFFTLVTFQRNHLLCFPENIQLLREAFRYVLENHPFVINAIVILPDHLHSLWTLPENDADYSTRWRLLKSYFSHNLQKDTAGSVPISRLRKNEKAVWQRRFWEHQIRDDLDYRRHIEYVHYNPVKHGLVKSPIDWEYSSFSRFVQNGVYPRDWGSSEEIIFTGEVGME